MIVRELCRNYDYESYFPEDEANYNDAHRHGDTNYVSSEGGRLVK